MALLCDLCYVVDRKDNRGDMTRTDKRFNISDVLIWLGMALLILWMIAKAIGVT